MLYKYALISKGILEKSKCILSLTTNSLGTEQIGSIIIDRYGEMHSYTSRTLFANPDDMIFPIRHAIRILKSKYLVSKLMSDNNIIVFKVRAPIVQ